MEIPLPMRGCFLYPWGLPAIAQVTGRPVVVKLNTGVDYRGVLACLDGYMNIAMEQVRVYSCEHVCICAWLIFVRMCPSRCIHVEQTEEYVNGQLKNKYGDAFIRGNNVLYISTVGKKR